MIWRALVPVKDTRSVKSRLAKFLTLAERRRLSQTMLDHVLRTLREVSEIELVGLLSSHRPVDPDVRWIRDEKRGLNAELTRARQAWPGSDVLIIHADLPLVTAGEIRSLLEAAQQSGIAIAPDRHGTGTNAVAIKAERLFQFSFGRASLQRHFADRSVCVLRPGLATDVDTEADLAQAANRGPGSLLGALRL